ncbi:hypothetical protein [uncultured Alistipes sp.]|uniref:hypothetical protein n=1 Tax=uncultured Alistipes sp. TaxID=538949 RepID=UPI0025CC09A3|nr:hypothetical protein [uncultured Alistipes sp.]
MTTATHTELMQIAKEAAEYITKLNGESKTFEIEGDTLTAVIAYEAEIGEDDGDRYTAPSWWVKHEEARVIAVYSEDGDDIEAAEWLKKMLN